MPTPRRTTLGTPEELDQHFADAIDLLRSVRRTLMSLLDRVEDGEEGLLKDVGLKTAELETAIKRAFEAEDRYNDWHARNSGLRRAAEIDFGALREEIACRLQRLADCCEGEV